MILPMLILFGAILFLSVGVFVTLKIASSYPSQEPTKQSLEISGYLIKGSIPNKYWRLSDYILFYTLVGTFLIIALAFLEIP